MIGAKFKGRLVVVGVALAVLAASAIWLSRQQVAIPVGFTSGKGRIEATEYGIVTQRDGRIEAVLVAEGDRVAAGQVLVRMDVQDLQAELRQADALLRRAREEKRQAFAQVSQKEADIKQSLSTIRLREDELALAKKDFERMQSLLQKDLIAKRQFEEAQTRLRTAEAALAQEQAKKLMNEALVKQAAVLIDQREAIIDAALANNQKIKAQISDGFLKSPVDGRVLDRPAAPGELLAAGGKVLTVLNLDEVYMTVFLPIEIAGRLSVGAEARIILDGAPRFVIPAAISLVAPRSQSTPKEVEAKDKRDKQLIRVTLKIAPDLLTNIPEKVKTGLPGVAYVRLDANAPWPENLQVKSAS